MGIAAHGLTAHLALDVAVVGQFEIDVDRHVRGVAGFQLRGREYSKSTLNSETEAAYPACPLVPNS